MQRPALPEWLGQVDLRGLRVAGAEVGLRFRREGEGTSFALLDAPRDVRVTMSA